MTRRGEEVVVSHGAAGVTCDGPSVPTVTNLDSVVVVKSAPSIDSFIVDHRGGPLMPGATAEPDRLTGARNRDILIGQAGGDCLQGREAADKLFGGVGRDVLRCGSGRDGASTDPIDVRHACERDIT